jgi:hypothetical protein
MIRFLLFSFLRFIAIAVVIYFVLTFIRNFIQGLVGTPPPSRKSNAPWNTPPKQKEEYRDIKDAKFHDVPNDDQQSSKTS